APADLQRVVRRCLAKDPDERYQTIKDLAIELKEVRHDLAGTAGLDTTVPPPSESKSTSSAQAATAQSAGAISGASGSLAARASSAEYIFSGIKQHKVAVVIAAAVIVMGILALSYYLHTRNTEVAIESIAVLPFVNQ